MFYNRQLFFIFHFLFFVYNFSFFAFHFSILHFFGFFDFMFSFFDCHFSFSYFVSRFSFFYIGFCFLFYVFIFSFFLHCRSAPGELCSPALVFIGEVKNRWIWGSKKIYTITNTLGLYLKQEDDYNTECDVRWVVL